MALVTDIEIVGSSIQIDSQGIATGFDETGYLYKSVDAVTDLAWELFFDFTLLQEYEAASQTALMLYRDGSTSGKSLRNGVFFRKDGSVELCHYSSLGTVSDTFTLYPAGTTHAGFRVKGKIQRTYSRGTFYEKYYIDANYDERYSLCGEYHEVPNTALGGVRISRPDAYHFRGSANLVNTRLDVGGVTVWQAGKLVPEPRRLRAIQGSTTKYWKHNYVNNVDVSGALQVDGSRLSGFSVYNFAKTIPENLSAYTATASSWEMQLKLYFVANTRDWQVFYGDGDSTYPSAFAVEASGAVNISIGSPSQYIARQSSTNTLQSNTLYWLKFLFTGTAYQVKVSTDGVNFDTWVSVSSTTKMPTKSNIWKLGVSGTSQYAAPMKYGYIDLTESYITIDGEMLWRGVEDVPIPATEDDYDYTTTVETITSIAKPTVTKYWKHNYSLNINTVGSLQIDGTKLSGFSTSNYAKTIPEDFAYYASSASNWEVQFKVYHVQNNNYHVLYANGLGHGTLFGITDTGCLDILVTNSSLSGYSVEMRTSRALQTNTLYWLKFMFTGTQYLIKVSTDGVSFSTWGIANVSNKVPYRSGAMWRIGVSAQRGYESPFNAGYIDLAESYIKTDGRFLWKGALDAPVPATPEDYEFTTEEKKYYVL